MSTSTQLPKGSDTQEFMAPNLLENKAPALPKHASNVSVFTTDASRVAEEDWFLLPNPSKDARLHSIFVDGATITFLQRFDVDLNLAQKGDDATGGGGRWQLASFTCRYSVEDEELRERHLAWAESFMKAHAEQEDGDGGDDDDDGDSQTDQATAATTTTSGTATGVTESVPMRAPPQPLPDEQRSVTFIYVGDGQVHRHGSDLPVHEQDAASRQQLIDEGMHPAVVDYLLRLELRRTGLGLEPVRHARKTIVHARNADELSQLLEQYKDTECVVLGRDEK